MRKNPAILVCTKLLNTFNVNFTKSTIISFLNNHPITNSIASISDLLKFLNVKHIMFFLDEKTLPHIEKCPTPFVTFVNENDGEIVLVENVQSGQVSYFSTIDGVKQIGLDKFPHSKVALVVTDAESAQEKNYFKNKFYELFKQISLVTTLVVSFLIITVYLFSIFNQNILLGSLFILKIAGLGITGLLIMRDVKEGGIVRKVCKKTTMNCSSILDSVDSSFLGLIKWSDLGFIYFFGGIITLIVANIFYIDPVSFLFVLNIATIIFSFYSISYQFFKKSWCIWCLITLTIFFLEFVIYTKVGTIQSYSRFGFLYMIIPFIVSFLLIVQLRLVLVKYFSYDIIEEELKKYKYNPQIFYEVLKSQNSISNYDKLAINYLKKEVTSTILLVTDPYCHNCMKVHEEIKYLIENEEINFSIKMVFKPSSDNYKSDIVCKAFCLIYEYQGEEAFLREYGLWYSEEPHKRYPYLMKVLQEYTNRGKESALFLEQQEYLQKFRFIDHSPMLFYKKYNLPEIYTLTDVNFFSSV